MVQAIFNECSLQNRTVLMQSFPTFWLSCTYKRIGNVILNSIGGYLYCFLLNEHSFYLTYAIRMGKQPFQNQPLEEKTYKMDQWIFSAVNWSTSIAIDFTIYRCFPTKCLDSQENIQQFINFFVVLLPRHNSYRFLPHIKRLLDLRMSYTPTYLAQSNHHFKTFLQLRLSVLLHCYV